MLRNKFSIYYGGTKVIVVFAIIFNFLALSYLAFSELWAVPIIKIFRQW